MERFLHIILILHIIGGFTALVSGLLAMVTPKGGKNHRLSGKFYFWGMTAVFISSILLSIFHHLPFLLMVGFFSYYMVVRGYRRLSLKKLGRGQHVSELDWLIALIAGAFIAGLLRWGIFREFEGNSFGRVAIVFALLGVLFLFSDVKVYLFGPKDKMHWWYTHIGSMGGGYIATITAFVVVNFTLKPGWILWLLPTVIGVPIIMVTIARYKKQFNKKQPASSGANLQQDDTVTRDSEREGVV
jgi:uncharacterized membrane protein